MPIAPKNIEHIAESRRRVNRAYNACTNWPYCLHIVASVAIAVALLGSIPVGTLGWADYANYSLRHPADAAHRPSYGRTLKSSPSATAVTHRQSTNR